MREFRGLVREWNHAANCARIKSTIAAVIAKRTLLVEDSILEQKILQAMLANGFPEVEVVAVVATLAEAEAAIQRHKENNAMREQVIQHYVANESSYRSVEAAAEAIAGKLVPAKHRTVAEWIREFRKLRSARRP